MTKKYITQLQQQRRQAHSKYCTQKMEDTNENVTIEKFINTLELNGDKCRLCLKETDEVWQLFEINNELPRKIMACAHVQVDEDDGLPSIICLTCRRLLDVSYNFKCQVEMADAKLRHIYHLKTTPIIEYETTMGVNDPLTHSVERVITETITDRMKINEIDFTVEDNSKNHVEISRSTTTDSTVTVDEADNQNCVVTINKLNDSNRENNHEETIIFNVDLSHRNHSENRYGNDMSEMVLKCEESGELEEKFEENKSRKPDQIDTDKNQQVIQNISHDVILMNNVLVEKLEQFDIIKEENCISICGKSDSSGDNESKIYRNDGNDDYDEDVDDNGDEVDDNDDDEDDDGDSSSGGDSMFVRAEAKADVDLNAGETVDSDEEKPLSSRTSRHKCTLCIKTFASKSALQRHTTMHIKNKTKLRYICYMCNKQFTTVDKLKNHVLTVHDSLKNNETNEDGLMSSDSVNIVQKSDEEVNEISSPIANIIRTENETTLKFPCKYCPKQFTYEKPFLMHAKSHPEYEGIRKNGSITIENKLLHTAELERVYELEDDNMPLEGLQCTQCGKLFATKRNLTRHLSTHTGLKFNCTTCQKEFSRLDKLKEHEQIKHKNEFFEQLDDDKNDDSDNEIKANHTETFKKDKHKRPHKCSLCPKAFAQAQSLTNHVERHKRVKDTQKRFLCEVCSKCFAQSGSLVAHMRTHTGVKPYVCKVCDRAFTKSTYLQLHSRTHSGEKPYICQYCSRAFARANTLARHITMHTGEAKYHCQICMKSFRRLTSLNEHTYTHTGQRPYACKICSKRYNNAGSLYAHTKKCKVQQSSSNSDNVSFNNITIDGNNPESGGATSIVMTHSDRKISNTATNVILNVTNAENVGNINFQSATSSSPSFIITNNVHTQKSPINTNVNEQQTVGEPSIYTVNTKHYKHSYYAIYPGM